MEDSPPPPWPPDRRGRGLLQPRHCGGRDQCLLRSDEVSHQLGKVSLKKKSVNFHPFGPDPPPKKCET